MRVAGFQLISVFNDFPAITGSRQDSRGLGMPFARTNGERPVALTAASLSASRGLDSSSNPLV